MCMGALITGYNWVNNLIVIFFTSMVRTRVSSYQASQLENPIPAHP